MMRLRCAALLAGILAGIGLWQLGQSAVVLAKAWIAPVLIEQAWNRADSGQTGDALRPWPWADATPVAKLDFPSIGSERIALSGGTDSAMAFGPTVVSGAPLPAVFGHRDTHFAILGDLSIGDELSWQEAGGEPTVYRVRETAILHKDSMRVPRSEDGSLIALVTCWPFDAARAGGSMRYVVLAERIDAATPIVQAANSSSE